MSDWRGYIILLFAVGIPLLFLVLRDERALLAWVCLTVSVNVFDARVGINFPAARLVGLMVLPFLPFGKFSIQALFRTTPFRLLVLQFGYLLLLGVIFGVLYPWPDGGFIRTFSQTTPGRALVYSVRMISDFGLVLFVARQVIRRAAPDEVLKFLLIGTTVAALGGLAEFVSQVQIYQVLTGYPIQEVAGRVRGLNYEPRALGLTMVHGLFWALLWRTSRSASPSRGMLGLIVLHAITLVLAVSASASIAAIVVCGGLAVLEPRVRRSLSLVTASGAALVIVLIVVGSNLSLTQTWAFNLMQRFSPQEVMNLSPATQIGMLEFFLDIFDLTALLALVAHPLAALVGAGPGLITVPASDFIPGTPRWSWVGAAGEGVTSLPSMGILLEWSNGGLPGVALWVAFAVAVVRRFDVLAARGRAGATDWRLARGYFVVGALAYLVQVSPLAAVWQVLVGLGLGASYLAAGGVEDPIATPPVAAGHA